jgi:tripartite-type tricarboxylate transporter receptor subunit TctC
MPEVQQSFSNIGAEVMKGTPAEFAALMKAELAKYAKVVKDANVRID